MVAEQTASECNREQEEMFIFRNPRVSSFKLHLYSLSLSLSLSLPPPPFFRSQSTMQPTRAEQLEFLLAVDVVARRALLAVRLHGAVGLPRAVQLHVVRFQLGQVHRRRRRRRFLSRRCLGRQKRAGGRGVATPRVPCHRVDGQRQRHRRWRTLHRLEPGEVVRRRRKTKKETKTKTPKKSTKINK